jgi:hypothetical protein
MGGELPAFRPPVLDQSVEARGVEIVKFRFEVGEVVRARHTHTGTDRFRRRGEFFFRGCGGDFFLGGVTGAGCHAHHHA